MIEKNEICIRVAVAYEQLDKCFTQLCRVTSRGSSEEILLEDLRSAMHFILEAQVKLGAIKREEDLHDL
jgi:hypothetical protein